MENLAISQLLPQIETYDVMNLWYDWFCKDSSLKNKGKYLLKKLKAISKSSKFDNDKCYVFFKNNCPGFGNLYDDFRICDIETGEVIFCVVPNNGNKGSDTYGEAEVWAEDANGEWGCQCHGSWTDIKKWFLKK
jgi:hypothetical protein